MAIILIGVVLIMPYYGSQNSAMSITSYVRSDVQFACSYLSAGVMKNETPYSYLNSILSAYGPVDIVFQNMSYSSGSNVSISVKLVSSNWVPPQLEREIRNFVVSDLLSRRILGGSLTSPTYNGKPFVLNVSVVIE